MRDGMSLEELQISDWNKIGILNEYDKEECFLLWKNIYEDNTPGFNFYCVNWICSDMDGSNIRWEVLFHGTAYFDGVRHLYFGKEETENYGYLYYCDVPTLIRALNELDKLQINKLPYVADERNQNN